MLKRMLAVVLCLAMVITMLPVQAIALETEEPTEMILETEPVEEVTEPAEEVTEPEEEETEPAEEVTEPAEEVTEPAEEVTEPAEEVTEPTEEETEPAEEVTEPAEEEPELMVLEAPDLDAEELLMGYLSPFYNGDGASSFGIMARDRLSGPNRHLYDGLRDLILRIGRGEENNTSIEVDFRGSGYSGEDVDITVVQNALLFDLPFEMYWYFRVWYALDVNSVWIILEPNAYYVPASGFDPNDAPYIDQSKTRKAAAAATNIGDIIDRYETASDYGKLCGYADEICALVEYDYDAAADSDSLFPKDNRSWTLINVFDGDITTKVVCEGYSEAFQYLCDESNFLGDVVCFSATGNNHKWNIVRIDGVSYLMDVTHCDNGDYAYRGPKFLGGGSGSVTGGYAIGGFLYKYYDETLDVYGDGEDSILKLSPVPYTPTGTYHVVYSVDGDTGLIASQTKTEGEELTITDEVPYILGYNFIGWVTSPTATEPDYQPGDTYSADADMVLYALFEESDVITGTEPGSSWVANVRYPGVTVLYTFRPEISGNYRIYSTADNDTVLDIYNGEGYWIAGDDDSGGSLQFQLDREFQAGEVYYLDVMFFGNTRTGELPFHISRQLTISYDANGGTGAPAAEYQYYQFPMALSDVIPTRGEDAFLGWATSPTATEAEYQPYDTYYAEDDVTLYAVWRSADCSHSFVDSVCEYCGITGGVCGDNLTWEYEQATGILTISGTGDMYDYTDRFVENATPVPWTKCYGISSIILEEGITSLGNYAFDNCDEVLQIVLPESLIAVGDYALPTRLTRLEIPENLSSLGYQSWYFMEEFVVSKENNTFVVSDGILFSKDMTKLVKMPAGWVNERYDHSFVDYAVPETVTEICAGAFDNCDFLRNLILPDSLEIIGDKALHCYGTGVPEGPETIVIPQNVRSIGSEAFIGVKLVVFTGDAPAMADEVFSSCTKTAYYPANNPTWTSDVMQDYGGDLTWISYGSDMPTSGEMSDTIHWSFDEETATLTVCGTGVMSGYNYSYFHSDFITPWLHLVDRIEHVVIEEGITEIGNRIFKNHYRLQTVTLPSSLRIICDSAFYNNTALREVEMRDGLITIEYGAFDGCSALESIRIPNTVTSLDAYAFFNCTSLTTVELSNSIDQISDCTFAGCTALTEILIPENVSRIGGCAFENCVMLRKVEFSGAAPFIVTGAFIGVTATAYYPADNETWTDEVLLNYGGTITWVPYGGVENRITIPTEELNGQTSVWIDGREYSVNTDSGTPYVDLPNGNAKTMVVYTYGESNGKSYPMGMKVWLLSNTDGLYTATRAEALDNILGYEGCSIRAGGQPGIRMITSVPDAMKYQLINGWEGYTLSEYGTAVAWADQISGSRPLTLGKSYVSHAYAYSLEDGKDPIHEPGDRIQYTNVLVGFTLDQCKEDIAMRPYMILADAEGNEITLYGGIVERSIGYIAQLNANAFDPETQADAYNFVHQIIDHVYGG